MALTVLIKPTPAKAGEDEFLQDSEDRSERPFTVRVITSQDKMDVLEYDNIDEGKSTLDRRFLELSYALGTRADLSLRFGEMAWDPQSVNGGTYDYGSAWGMGIQWRFAEWEEGNQAVGCTFQFNHAKPEDRVRNDFSTVEGEIEEWQVGLEAMRRFHALYVFGGAHYAQTSLIYSHPSAHGIGREGGWEQQDDVDLYAGAEWYVLPVLSVSGEWRGLARQGGTLSLAYHF